MINLTSNLKIRDLENNKTYDYPGLKIQQKIENNQKKLVSQQKTFERDVLVGLSKTPKKLPSKYLYDDNGSKIFQEIMNLDEYYLTKTEYQILKSYSKKIISSVHQKNNNNSKINLIELGAGDGKKTSLLLNELCSRKLSFEYAPIDISRGAMITLMKRLESDFDQIQSEGIVSDYLDGINWIKKNKSNFNFVLFLGSNIGNFDKEMTIHFLRKLWELLNHGDCLLISFDLKKEIQILQKAYSDTSGVTSRFNINLLARINRELDGNFNLNKFEHYATYNPILGAMESYLISSEAQIVQIQKLNRSFTFNEKEPLHTEYSFKYTSSEIKELSQKIGFDLIENYYDNNHFFVDSLWRVNKA